MKRIVLSVMFFLAAALIFGQELSNVHANKTDGQGRKQGHWKVYDTNGNIKLEGNYVNGKPIGLFKFFYPDGHKKALINNLDSGKVTYATLFHENGNLMAKGKYLKQQKDSLWQYFDQENGKLLSEEFYSDGKKQGIVKTYYPSGEVAEEVTYKNDVKDGPWKQYFTDGAIKGKGTYVNGEPDGMYIMYHINGNVQVSGKYAAGEKEGVWVYLSSIGQMEKKEIYQKGLLISEENMETKNDSTLQQKVEPVLKDN